MEEGTYPSAGAKPLFNHQSFVIKRCYKLMHYKFVILTYAVSGVDDYIEDT